MKLAQLRTNGTLQKSVHILSTDVIPPYMRTLCGMPQCFGNASLEETTDDVTCQKCLRHYARELGQIVEVGLCEEWGVKPWISL